MKKKTLLVLFNSFLVIGALPSARAQGTAFTYQGKLTDDCCPATGLYDLRFKVYDDPDAGMQLPTPTPVTFTTNAVPVTNGLFTVRLDFDSPGSTVSAVFTGTRRWLQIEARTNNSPAGFVLLLPRTELTATPYAIYAGKAGNAATLNGQSSSAFAPASGSSAYVAKAGDTMTGTLRLPANGLVAGADQLVLANGNVGIGTNNPMDKLHVAGNYLRVEGAAGQAAYMGNAGSFQGVSFGSLNPSISEIDFFNPSAGFMNAVMNDLTSFGNIITDGKVGVGTNNPQAKLHVVGILNGVLGQSHNPGDSGVIGLNTGGGYGISGRTSSTGVAVLGDNDDPAGWAGVFNGRVQIASATAGRLHVLGTSAPGPNIPTDTTVLAAGDGFHNRFMSVSGDNALYLSMWNGDYGELSTYNYATGQPLPLKLNVNGGHVVVPVLEITGGADLAEPFQMSTKEILKGALVTIDEENAGQLKMSDRAYDTRVAGILSGANGINPGIQLHQEGALEGGQNVALSGRVYALADASDAPIKPGDLLTTSATPGHCMKVTDHAKAQGAIIGKAMSSLDSGKGLVLVLVSLQ